MGSLKGTPSSITVAPELASSTKSWPVVSKSGSPATMKGMKPFFPSRFSLPNTSAMRLNANPNSK
jgi:hypothetical protein